MKKGSNFQLVPVFYDHKCPQFPPKIPMVDLMHVMQLRFKRVTFALSQTLKPPYFLFVIFLNKHFKGEVSLGL